MQQPVFRRASALVGSRDVADAQITEQRNKARVRLAEHPLQLHRHESALLPRAAQHAPCSDAQTLKTALPALIGPDWRMALSPLAVGLLKRVFCAPLLTQELMVAAAAHPQSARAAKC